MSGLLVFGGSGGIGQALADHSYLGFDHVTWLSSLDCDIADAEAVRQTVERADPDAVLHLAMRNTDGMIHKIGSTSEALNVGIDGLVNVLSASMAHFRARGSGTFVYASSVLSRHYVPGTGIYGASKAFGERLVRQAGLENAHRGVSCVSVRLGYFPAGLWNTVPPAIQDATLAAIPAKRLGTIAELGAVLQMAFTTPYLNGGVIDLTGGL